MLTIKQTESKYSNEFFGIRAIICITEHVPNYPSLRVVVKKTDDNRIEQETGLRIEEISALTQDDEHKYRRLICILYRQLPNPQDQKLYYILKVCTVSVVSNIETIKNQIQKFIKHPYKAEDLAVFGYEYPAYIENDELEDPDHRIIAYKLLNYELDLYNSIYRTSNSGFMRTGLANAEGIEKRREYIANNWKHVFITLLTLGQRLYEAEVFHFDLKPGNIIMHYCPQKAFNFKIIDLDSARKRHFYDPQQATDSSQINLNFQYIYITKRYCSIDQDELADVPPAQFETYDLATLLLTLLEISAELNIHPAKSFANDQFKNLIKWRHKHAYQANNFNTSQANKTLVLALYNEIIKDSRLR